MLSLIPFVVLAVGIAVALAMYAVLRREMRLHIRRQGRKIELILAKLEDGSSPLRSGIVPLRPGLRQGFNRIHRVEALRLLRRGEGTSHVAAVLGVPSAEVELLIRVHGLAREPRRAHVD